MSLAGGDGNIGSQFPLGVSLPSEPHQDSGSKQRKGEQGYYRSANRDYFGVVFSNKFKNALDKALFITLLVFFFAGPVIGHAFFFFLYRRVGFWAAFGIGCGINFSWLCLIL